MQTVASTQRREISPQWVVPLMRLVQLGFILMVVVTGFSLEVSLVFRLLAILLVSGICIAVGHPFASISGDEEGLYVQRYVRVHSVNWAEVSGARASLNDSGIRIDFLRPVGGLRYAVANFPNMGIKDAAAVAMGGKQPEIVTWICEHIRSAEQPNRSSSTLGLP